MDSNLSIRAAVLGLIIIKPRIQIPVCSRGFDPTFGGLKQMNYGNGRSLSLSYNNRMFLTQWNIPGVLGWNYAYNYFNEQSGRVV